MIDHISIVSNNLEKSRDFYAAALKPFGYESINSIDDVASWNMGITGCSFGENKETRLWISGEGERAKAHIAFGAKDHATVDAFYAAAIAAGGTDNGAPGLRTQYSPDYYAAFVIDPDGNNIEAVCRH